ncbi:MAG: Rpn family recombination-promoting nuclease/putative transposase [Planctomycetota bacterium]
MPQPSPHDALVKRVFSRPDTAAPYLASVLPAELTAVLDLAALELERGTFVDPDLSERLTDLLYLVPLRGEGKAFVYVLVEAQSTVIPDMALRLFVYLGRIWDDWRAKHPGQTRPPAILPVVLLVCLGGIQFERGRLREAERALSRALELEPRPWTCVYLGRTGAERRASAP